MKKTILTVIALAFLITASHATKTKKVENIAPVTSTIITGQITDNKSGEELTGVAVKIKGTDIISYTDFEGNFSFSDIQPGSYELDIEMISYKKFKTKKIQVKANEAHDLSIKLKQDI